MRSDALARAYMGLIGITLVVVGLLGFIGNPIVDLLSFEAVR